MCGRYQLSVNTKQISLRFHVEVYDELYNPRFNCAPSQNLPVITNTQPGTLQFYRWGLIPYWAKDMKIGYRLINARAETLNSKPSFKKAFERKRCLIPANGFYEWKKTDNRKTPYRFYLKGERLFAMAGLWDRWQSPEGKHIHSFTIITTEPNTLVSTVHNRMPVILPEEKEKIWLKENNPEILKSLLTPYPDEEMEYYPISPKINSPANDGPEIITSLKGEEGYS